MIEYVLGLSVILIKVLLFTTQQSTDFDVHRNWKVITTSLPISKWYYDKASIWTLDYPPLFAYMECVLGQISKLFTPKVTSRAAQGNEWEVVFYQRMTVLFGDVLMFFAIRRLCRGLALSKGRFCLLLVSLQSFAGLVIVDNMHFQYNTILFAIFFLSIAFIADESFIAGAVMFSIAMCFKHIFVYMAPAFVIFYLQNYVFQAIKLKDKCVLLLKLIASIGTVVALAFSPFIVICLREGNFDQFKQIKSQLFPFQRGLLHSYWAPNIWAIYSFIDKVLFFVVKRSSGAHSKNTSALGMTQETGFDVLPDITPAISTMILVTALLLFMTRRFLSPFKDGDGFELKNVNVMTTVQQRKRQNTSKLLKDCMLSNLIFFNFGYQVHEKAFIIISLMMLVFYFCKEDVEQVQMSNMLFMALAIGILAQVPLIHDYRDYLAKLCLVIAYLGFAKTGLMPKERIDMHLLGYISISLVLDFIAVFKPSRFIEKKFPFLPLMSFSVLSACFVQMFFITLLLSKKVEKTKH